MFAAFDVAAADITVLLPSGSSVAILCISASKDYPLLQQLAVAIWSTL